MSSAAADEQWIHYYTYTANIYKDNTFGKVIQCHNFTQSSGHPKNKKYIHLNFDSHLCEVQL